MKTVFFEIEDWERPLLVGRCRNLDYSVTAAPLTADNAHEYKDAEIISAFIYSRLDAETLRQMPALRMVATRSTGTDHIDMDYCFENKITVANVPGYGSHTVAEHVFALILALSRHLREALQQTREGRFNLSGLCGFDLYGKTIGIIGTGDIGMRTAEIARGFGMHVLGHDIHPDMQAAKQVGFTYTALDRLLAQSDIVSLHVPSTPSTRSMISAREFGLMKNGAYLVNTARGPVIDVKALLHALHDGTLAGAALDVLPDEPPIREEAELLRANFSRQQNPETILVDHALLHHPKVIVTPHCAFYTREAVERILSRSVDSILAFLGRESVTNAA